MLTDAEPRAHHAHHYDFETPAPSFRGSVPEYLKHLPPGASAWMEHRHIRALRMHARKYGWLITYRVNKEGDGYIATNEEDRSGRVWRLK